MIFSHWGSDLLAVTQNDHAAFAGELLSLWRADGMEAHPRRESLIFATRRHDNGWLELDSAPRCSADGQPYDFLTLPSELRLELWQLGIRRYLGKDPYGALLILHHGRQLHQPLGDCSPWAETLAAWKSLEEELAEELAVSHQQIESDYRFLHWTDTLSLTVCARWLEPFELGSRQVRARFSENGPGELSSETGTAPGPATLEIDPFPLAGSTTFRIAGRRIPNRKYYGDSDLAMELATARWYRQIVRVVPGSG